MMHILQYIMATAMFVMNFGHSYIIGEYSLRLLHIIKHFYAMNECIFLDTQQFIVRVGMKLWIIKLLFKVAQTHTVKVIVTLKM